MKKTIFLSSMLSISSLIAADFLPSKTEEHPLPLHVEKFKTSHETIDQKTSILADDFADLFFDRYRTAVIQKEEQDLGDCIHSIEPLYNAYSEKGPERKPTNLGLLKDQRIRDFITSFASQKVRKNEVLIKNVQIEISEKWDSELQRTMRAIDLCLLIEKKLYQKLLNHEQTKVAFF
jgi:hypothetical protein